MVSRRFGGEGGRGWWAGGRGEMGGREGGVEIGMGGRGCRGQGEARLGTRILERRSR